EYDIIVDDAPSSPNQKELVWNSIVQMMPMLTNIQLPPQIMLLLLEYSPFPSSLVAKMKQAAMESSQGQQPSPMDMIMAEKKADVDAEQAKHQLRLQAKNQENALEFRHKQALSKLDIESQRAQEMIRVWGKQQDAAHEERANVRKSAIDAAVARHAADLSVHTDAIKAANVQANEVAKAEAAREHARIRTQEVADKATLSMGQAEHDHDLNAAQTELEADLAQATAKHKAKVAKGAKEKVERKAKEVDTMAGVMKILDKLAS